MQPDEQRKLGIKLAREYNAPRTLEVIRDRQSTYSDIFKTAADELGPQKLAEIVEAQDSPIWAVAALEDVEGLGAHAERLTKIAGRQLSQSTIGAQQLAQFTQENSGGMPPTPKGEVGSFALRVKPGASFVASYTMFWTPVDGGIAVNPAFGYPGETPPMRWSGNICVSKTGVMKCADFALPKAELAPGATVWMIVSVHGGRHYDTSGECVFVYADNQKKAHITADGGLAKASFTYDGIV